MMNDILIDKLASDADNAHENEGKVWTHKFTELIVGACIKELESSRKGDPYTGQVADCEYNNCIDEQIEVIKGLFGIGEFEIKVGDRIKVLKGFNVGARGEVKYIEPSGKMWVRRDHSNSDVFYLPDEVVKL